jgi:pimeloyl-ACP methyl ester carboxylesterase
VIRYDNRDTGLSTKFEEHGTPNLVALMSGKSDTAPPYTLDDMAADGIGLIDALGFESAHVCGASMGGMIVQTMAIQHPDKVKSMTSIMSTTGNPELPPADPAAISQLMAPPATNREEAMQRSVDAFKVFGSPGFEFDEARVREKAGRSFDRCFLPSGQGRQMAALLNQSNRVPALQKLDLPVLVIHGAADPLVPVAGGKDTANAIPGAELMLIEGMGHDMPREVHPRIASAIDALAKRAEARAQE